MIGLTAPGADERRAYRGLKTPQHLRLDVTWGRAEYINVPAGALVSITNIDGCGSVFLTTLTAKTRNFSTDGLDVPQALAQSLGALRFDQREMAQRAATRDTTLNAGSAYEVFSKDTKPGEMFVMKVSQAVALYVIAPISEGYIDEGGGSHFAVQVQPAAQNESPVLLPEPLGRVCEERRVPSGTAWAYELKKGQYVQILDVDGQQCSDFMAMRASALDNGLERYIDGTISRTMARSAYPLPGLFDTFYDQDIHPLMKVTQDTVGRHDTFALACTANGYEERGFPGHVNCSDNISNAFAPFGIARRPAWPAMNFFFNSWIDWQHHGINADEAWSRPGDYVVLEALTDLVCVSTACPDDIDPINGWNPTDVHVRIYEEDTSISHSVVWRAEPEDQGKLTKGSAFHPRTSELTSKFHPARDLWMAQHYDATGAVGEYWACRRAATLQDMSGLRKFDIIGPDAEELLQLCLTRNVAKLARHRGLYGLICDERGTVLDDGTLFRLDQSLFRWCCGSDASALHLREQATKFGLNVSVRSLGDKMVNLALQGPKSRKILEKIVYVGPSKPEFDNVKWFGFTIARLGSTAGPPVMLARSGFTGELGYELFCDAGDALAVWDSVMEAGAPDGLVPMGGEALEMLRIEAGLMVAGAEFSPDCDALEAGLGFAVDFKKESFIGRDALERNASAERRKLVGLRFTGNEVPHHGDRIYVGREAVGVVTSASYSPEFGRAIAMARVAIETAELGTRLEVGQLDGFMKRLPCEVVSLPFLDPKREKPRS